MQFYLVLPPMPRETQKELMKMINTDFNYSYRKARAGAEVEEGKCGRYASAALSMAGTVILAGGMTNCDDKHQVRAVLQLDICNTSRSGDEHREEAGDEGRPQEEGRDVLEGGGEDVPASGILLPRGSDGLAFPGHRSVASKPVYLCICVSQAATPRASRS